jgi:hypothetical protein
MRHDAKHKKEKEEHDLLDQYPDDFDMPPEVLENVAVGNIMADAMLAVHHIAEGVAPGVPAGSIGDHCQEHLHQREEEEEEEEQEAVDELSSSSTSRKSKEKGEGEDYLHYVKIHHARHGTTAKTERQRRHTWPRMPGLNKHRNAEQMAEEKIAVMGTADKEELLKESAAAETAIHDFDSKLQRETQTKAIAIQAAAVAATRRSKAAATPGNKHKIRIKREESSHHRHAGDLHLADVDAIAIAAVLGGVSTATRHVCKGIVDRDHDLDMRREGKWVQIIHDDEVRRREEARAQAEAAAAAAAEAERLRVEEEARAQAQAQAAAASRAAADGKRRLALLKLQKKADALRLEKEKEKERDKLHDEQLLVAPLLKGNVVPNHRFHSVQGQGLGGNFPPGGNNNPQQEQGREQADIAMLKHRVAEMKSLQKQREEEEEYDDGFEQDAGSKEEEEWVEEGGLEYSNGSGVDSDVQAHVIGENKEEEEEVVVVPYTSAFFDPDERPLPTTLAKQFSPRMKGGEGDDEERGRHQQRQDGSSSSSSSSSSGRYLSPDERPVIINRKEDGDNEKEQESGVARNDSSARSRSSPSPNRSLSPVIVSSLDDKSGGISSSPDGIIDGDGDGHDGDQKSRKPAFLNPDDRPLPTAAFRKEQQIKSSGSGSGSGSSSSGSVVGAGELQEVIQARMCLSPSELEMLGMHEAGEYAHLTTFMKNGPTSGGGGTSPAPPTASNGRSGGVAASSGRQVVDVKQEPKPKAVLISKPVPGLDLSHVKSSGYGQQSQSSRTPAPGPSEQQHSGFLSSTSAREQRPVPYNSKGAADDDQGPESESDAAEATNSNRSRRGTDKPSSLSSSSSSPPSAEEPHHTGRRIKVRHDDADFKVPSHLVPKKHGVAWRSGNNSSSVVLSPPRYEKKKMASGKGSGVVAIVHPSRAELAAAANENLARSSIMHGSTVFSVAADGEIVYHKPYSTYKKPTNPQYYYDEKSGLFSNFESEAKRELRHDGYTSRRMQKKKEAEIEAEFLREKLQARALLEDAARRKKEFLKEVSRAKHVEAMRLQREQEARFQDEIDDQIAAREQREAALKSHLNKGVMEQESLMSSYLGRQQQHQHHQGNNGARHLGGSTNKNGGKVQQQKHGFAPAAPPFGGSKNKGPYNRGRRHNQQQQYRNNLEFHSDSALSNDLDTVSSLEADAAQYWQQSNVPGLAPVLEVPAGFDNTTDFTSTGGNESPIGGVGGVVLSPGEAAFQSVMEPSQSSEGDEIVVHNSNNNNNDDVKGGGSKVLQQPQWQADDPGVNGSVLVISDQSVQESIIIGAVGAGGSGLPVGSLSIDEGSTAIAMRREDNDETPVLFASNANKMQQQQQQQQREYQYDDDNDEYNSNQQQHPYDNSDSPYHQAPTRKPAAQEGRSRRNRHMLSQQNARAKAKINGICSSGYGSGAAPPNILAQQRARRVRKRNPLVNNGVPAAAVSNAAAGGGGGGGGSTKGRHKRVGGAHSHAHASPLKANPLRYAKNGATHKQKQQQHQRQRASQGHSDWSQVPIELNPQVIPLPVGQQHPLVLAEYESSASGLYAGDGMNNGGGSIVSIGINEDGSVTVSNLTGSVQVDKDGVPLQDFGDLDSSFILPAEADQPVAPRKAAAAGDRDGADDTLTGLAGVSPPRHIDGGRDVIDDNDSTGGGEVFNPRPNPNLGSLFDYDIPLVASSANDHGVLGPAEEGYDAVLGDNSNSNSNRARGGGGDNGNGNNDALGLLGFAPHSSFDDDSSLGGLEVGDWGAADSPEPAADATAGTAEQQQQQQQQQQQDYIAIQPSFDDGGDDADDGALALSRSHSDDIHYKHKQEHGQQNYPLGGHNNPQQQQQQQQQCDPALLEHSRQLKAQSSDDDGLERQLRTFRDSQQQQRQQEEG